MYGILSQVASDIRPGSAKHSGDDDVDHSGPRIPDLPLRKRLDPGIPLQSFAQRLVIVLSDSIDNLALVEKSSLEKALAMKFARALDDVRIMELTAAEKKLDQAASYAGKQASEFD